MQLNNAQAVLRPRNPWEAMDLGILLAAPCRCTHAQLGGYNAAYLHS